MQEGTGTPSDSGAGEPSIETLDSDILSREETVRTTVGTTAGSAVSEDPEEAFAAEDEDEDADDDDGDGDSTSGGDDESVYSSEDDDDDDEDNSTEQPLGPIGRIFAQRRDSLHETYLRLQSSCESKADSAESSETAGARASWTDWVQHTEFMQRERMSHCVLTDR
jgi:hypothetical protein